MENQIYKVTYKHDQTGMGRVEFMIPDSFELRSKSLHDVIESWCFHNIHRYNSLEDKEKGRWHGTFTFSYQKVSRQSDEDIYNDIQICNKEIEICIKQLDTSVSEIKRLTQLLENPYLIIE